MRITLAFAILLAGLIGCKSGKKDSSDASSDGDKSAEGQSTDDEEDDFVVAESSAYISGTNLVEETLSVTEIGGKGRSPALTFDANAGTFSGTLPDDGYFVIRLGDKAGIVGSSGGGVKVALRRYHQVTAKLLELAAVGPGKDLFDRRAVDLGAFAYLGETLYRTSRRKPGLLAEGTTLAADVAARLVERNLAVVANRGADAVATSVRDAYRSAQADIGPARQESVKYRAISAAASAEVTPKDVCHHLNQVFCETTAAKATMTCFVARFHADRRTLTYCNAGHTIPYVLVARRSGEEESPALQSLKGSSDPIGFDPGTAYKDRSRAFAAGDRLVLYTDGLTENAKGFTLRQLREVLNANVSLPAPELKAKLLAPYEAAVRKARAGDDDMMLLVAALR